MTALHFARGRLSGLNMRLCDSPAEYMVNQGWINEEQVSDILGFMRLRGKLQDKNTVQFELTAFQRGYVDDKTLVEAITGYRGIEVVQKEELNRFEVTFANFGPELCEKNNFFEYNNPASAPGTVNIIAALDSKGLEIIRRNFERYVIRYTIPSYVAMKLEEASDNKKEEGSDAMA